MGTLFWALCFLPKEQIFYFNGHTCFPNGHTKFLSGPNFTRNGHTLVPNGNNIPPNWHNVLPKWAHMFPQRGTSFLPSGHHWAYGHKPSPKDLLRYKTNLWPMGHLTPLAH